MRKYTADGLLWSYGLIVLAALIVSTPATYKLASLYHNDGSAAGIAATVALLVILEAGAVASKLAKIWAREGMGALELFCIAALGVNTLSNFVYGGSLAAARGLHPIAAWAGALVYAAFLPGLIYLMLTLFCARVAGLRGLRITVEDEVARTLLPVAHAVAVARQASAALAELSGAPALMAPQASYARPVAQRTEPVLMPQMTCPICGTAASRMQLVTAPQHQGWRCSCGHKVPLTAIPRPDGL